MTTIAAKDKSDDKVMGAKVSPMRDFPEEGKRGLFADAMGLKRLWPYLRRDARLVLIAALLIPVISILETTLPIVLKHAVDQGITGRSESALLEYSLFYLALVLGGYAARAGQSVAASLAVHRMIRNLRRKLFVHVLGLKAAFHDKSMSGSLVTRATGDFDNLSDSLNMGVLTSVVDVAVLIGCVVGMFLLNWRLALTALVILPLVGFIVQWFSKALKAAMLKARVKIAALNAFTQECLYGHASIKLLTAEPAATSRYERLNIEFRDAQMSSVVLDAVMFAVLDGIASVTLGLILWLIVSRFTGNMQAAISAGVIVAFVQYIQQLFEPLKQLGNKMAMLQGAFTSIDRIFGVLSRDEAIQGETKVTKLAGEVEFRHVSFSYGTQGSILHDVNLHLSPGKSLALVGATGSGKSTIVKLVAKLYDGYQGEILIDGRDLRHLSPTSLRQKLAIVPQDIVLFDGTVAFNIGMGAIDASMDRVRAAARAVGADDFIGRLPRGYDSEIREGGANLSHGQRQLLAFARALVRDPGLVILDEATSSVDPESEAIIQTAIAQILHDRTVIVIAHRLSTIRQCDEIVVVDKGRIVEAGTHQALLAAKGAYFGLHEALT